MAQPHPQEPVGGDPRRVVGVRAWCCGPSVIAAVNLARAAQAGPTDTITPVVGWPIQATIPFRGAVDGAVNRLKQLKAAMYGRAQPDLLRKLVLLA